MTGGAHLPPPSGEPVSRSGALPPPSGQPVPSGSPPPPSRAPVQQSLPEPEPSSRVVDRSADKAEAKRLKKEAHKAEKAHLAELKSAKQAERREMYGDIVVDDMLLATRVRLYSKGYVSLGLAEAEKPEQLLGISVSADVAKKTAIGRGVVAALTMGTNLMMNPTSLRGDLYVIITTDLRTKTFHLSPPTEGSVKTARKLAAVGEAILTRLQNERLETAAVSGGVQSTPVLAAPADLGSQLFRLAELHAAGVLTDEEFSAAKKKLL